jgi:hypothetical protein
LTQKHTGGGERRPLGKRLSTWIFGYDQLPHGDWWFICESHDFRTHSLFKTWLHERFFCKPEIQV